MYIIYLDCEEHDGFKCNDGRCLPCSFLCDGDNDCGNWEDEDPECEDGKVDQFEKNFVKHVTIQTDSLCSI